VDEPAEPLMPAAQPAGPWHGWSRHRPLLASVLCCLGIQGVLAVLLLAVATLSDPGRSRPDRADVIVKTQARFSAAA
jgi:hypothetical protein